MIYVPDAVEPVVEITPVELLMVMVPYEPASPPVVCKIAYDFPLMIAGEVAEPATTDELNARTIAGGAAPETIDRV